MQQDPYSSEVATLLSQADLSANNAQRTSVNIDVSPNAPAEHAAVLRAAGAVLERVMMDARFPQEVARAEYPGGTQFRERSGKVISIAKDKIAEIIIQGIERDTAPDYQLDMRVIPHNHPKGIVGSAILGKGPIRPAIWFLNRCVQQKDAISLGRHLMHEWLHVAGFFHRKKGPDQGDVPYVIGDVVRKLARDESIRASLAESGLSEFLQEDQEAVNWLKYYEDEVRFDDEQEWWSWEQDDDL